MQKFTWLDTTDEPLFEAELEALEEDQAFLEHYYGVSMLLDALSDSSALDDDADLEDSGLDDMAS